MTKRAVIFDIDGVIADASYVITKYLLNKKKPNWEEYYENLDTCKLNKWAKVKIDDYMSNGYEVILITSRSEVSRGITTKWLKTNKVKYNELYMRKEKDFRPSDVVKRDLYMEKVHGKYEVKYVYEDDIGNIRMFECFGITCIPIACEIIYSNNKEKAKV